VLRETWVVYFSPRWASPLLLFYPQLALGAAFLRRLAAKLGRSARKILPSAWKTAMFRMTLIGYRDGQNQELLVLRRGWS
jgi:hypothetical protein